MRLYYTKCKDLPMDIFVDVLVNDNIKALAVLWWPKRLLRKVWDNIFSEYSTLIDGEQASVSLSLIKDINYMRNKLYIIHVAVYALKLKYSERACNILRSQGYDFKFREDTYLQDCERVLKRSKTILADAIRKEKEYEKLGTGKTLVEQDYIDMCYAISKHSSMHLSIRKITVSEFCAAYNAYSKDMQALKAKAEANKR